MVVRLSGPAAFRPSWPLLALYAVLLTGGFFRSLQFTAYNALAYADIPRERVRMHVCWGNYEGPHHCDAPFELVFGMALTADVGALMFEAANPRHAHEWTWFQDHPLDDGLILIPGVIDSTTNFIEHPELVAQRIQRFADLVGRERVIAGTDCGFGTFAGFGAVDGEIAWAKLRTLAEGAQIAS